MDPETFVYRWDDINGTADRAGRYRERGVGFLQGEKICWRKIIFKLMALAYYLHTYINRLQLLSNYRELPVPQDDGERVRGIRLRLG